MGAPLPAVAALVSLALVPTLAAQSGARPAASLAGQLADPDGDGDGLSDFHEVHKHRTDPKKRDSDGDGVPDGDWRERREFAYTVRSVVHVMRPATIAHLTADYQDARVLDETHTHVELEVIHYPLNTVADALRADPKWRQQAAKLADWTKPGPTADWTPKMRDALVAELKKDGIDALSLDDRTLVERAAEWLCKRAKVVDGFTSFLTAFDEHGKPYVPDELRAAAENGIADKKLSLEEQWQRELSARGMFEHKTRGSCTSSAIYLNGCLRALGVPTRIVLCIPLVDANDDGELELVRKGIAHPEVRRVLVAKLGELKGSWASHTFNEVMVGGRWRRLNFERLGQNTYDKGFFGLMTHVATFGDWADAEMPKTIGRRSKLKQRDDVFGGPNPYSAIAVRDELGRHCTLPPPVVAGGGAPGSGQRRVSVTEVLWTDSPELPAAIRENCKRSERFGLIARLVGLDGADDLRSLLAEADHRVHLEAKDRPPLGIGFDPGCWWYEEGGKAWIYVPFGAADRRDLAQGIPYRFRPRNQSATCLWDTRNVPEVVRR